MFWGDPELQGLHVGIFIALARAVALLGAAQPLRRPATRSRPSASTRTRPSTAASAPARNYVKVMAICGAVRRPRRRARRARLAVPDRHQRHPGLAGRLLRHRRRAARPQHGDRHVAAALLFGALLNGTSVRNLDPAVFQPQLATNLTFIIQGLIVLFVSAPVLVTRCARRGGGASAAAARSPRRRRRMSTVSRPAGGRRPRGGGGSRLRGAARARLARRVVRLGGRRARRARVLPHAAADLVRTLAPSIVLALAGVALGARRAARRREAPRLGRGRGLRRRRRGRVRRRSTRASATSSTSSCGRRCSRRCCATRRR